jgi:transglutaminase-like putative cysteine protease
MLPATLSPTRLIDSDHPAVRAFAQTHARGADDRERAVALYGAVRDGFRYDPYRVDMTPAGMKASTVIGNGYGWCVPKAALLAAACRAAGIPARVGYADVRNHLSTERLRQTLQTDVFAWHGYTDIWLDGAWRKATPAFNVELCDRFGLHPLEFDGTADSLYHPFDRAGNRHMEYMLQRGAFDDVPLAQMLETFYEIYPRWIARPGSTAPTQADLRQSDFLADVARETGAA